VLLDLSEIVVRAGMRSTVEVDQECVEDEDLRFAEPLAGSLTFQNSGDLLRITGRVRTVLEIACARCLADVRFPIDLQVDEGLPISEVTHPDAKPKEGEEFDTFIPSIIHLDAGRPILDVDELLRQQIVSEVPIRTLCGAACRGLCPRCGADLNQGPCACPPEEGESPFAGLRALLDESNGKDPDEGD
jgi:uncharacterized protein